MWLFGMGRCDDCQACIYLRFTLFTCSSGSCEGIVFGIVSSPLSACLCRRTFYRPTNWGRVGWGGVGWGVIRQYCKTWCDATLRMGWGGVGGLWYHSSVLQDMMRCYATHGVGWGGCDIIRQYCKTWCDATLRMGWGGVGHDACYATHGVGWGWVVISFVSTARHDVRRYAWQLEMGWGCPDIIRSQVQGKRNGLLFKYIRSQQWRWEHTGFDLLTATGEAVRSLMRWREKATLFVRRVLQHKTL